MPRIAAFLLTILPILSIAQNSRKIEWVDIEKADQLRKSEPRKVKPSLHEPYRATDTSSGTMGKYD